MTHTEFNKLYGSGAFELKIFKGTMEDGEERIVESFEWNGKYFLRIHKELKYVINRRRKSYGMVRESHIIKEFESASQANNYFKKVSGGRLKRIEWPQNNR